MDHGDLHHVLFFFVVALLLLVLLVSPKDKLATAKPTGMTISQGVVCCTFTIDEKTRTCVTPEGRNCDACASVCNAHT